jgi:hypothetical protein
VKVKFESVNLAVGNTTDTVTSEDATATTTFDVKKLQAGVAKGSITVSGSAPADANGKTGFAFSYGAITASVNGKNLAGKVTVKPRTFMTFTPQLVGQQQRVDDPLNFIVTDMSGNTLFSQTLFDYTANVQNGSQLSWDNNLLLFNAGSIGENASLKIDVSPLSGSPSGLLLTVQNGSVIAATKSGPLFDSLSLPSLRSPGAFTLALPNDFAFNYDLSRFGDQEITATANWSEDGFTGVTTPEPSALALAVIGSLGLLGFARLRRRQMAG